MGQPEDQASLQQEPRSKRTASMALATFLMIIGLTLSKGTGFLRETFIGIQFGFGNIFADSFYLGFQIPDLFFQLLVGGSIQAAITPTLARSLERGDQKRGWRSVSIFITLMTVIMLVTTSLGMLLSEWIFPLIYADKVLKTPEIVALAAQSSKALFPQVFFMMLAALCIGILNAYKKFSSTAFGPTLYNICVVLSIVFLGGRSNQAVINTAIGITISAALYFFLQFYMARRELKRFRFSLDIKDEGFRELLRLAVPTMISASIVQLNTIIITSFTAGFDDGIIQSLNNAKTIWQLPYGIFAVAVGSVMLPSLSAHFAAKDNKAARVLLGKSLRNALFLTIPSAGLLFALRLDVVLALFRWNAKFVLSAGETTALILMGYCIAIILQTVVFIYNQAFYAIGKTKIPLITGVLSMVLIAGICYILKSFGLLTSTSQVGALGLSLAYSFTSAVSALVLSVLYRKNKQLAPKSIWAFLVRSGICFAVLILVVYTLNVLPVDPQSKAGQLAWLAFRGICGFGGYLLAARTMQMKELSSFADRIRRRRNPSA